VVEYGTPILRAAVGALAIQLGWVVRPEEELDELGVRDLCRVKLDAAGFGVRGRPAAHLAVGWRVDLAASVANLGLFETAFEVLVVLVLGAPEAAVGDRGSLQSRPGGR